MRSESCKRRHDWRGRLTKHHSVVIAGGGPAGAAAAIAARQQGLSVEVIERSRGSRHKVCGEFLSPGIRPIMEALHLWDDFASLQPCPLRRCALHFGRHTKRWTFFECGWGLSRLELDRLLREKAVGLGAGVRRGEAFHAARAGDAAFLILACGRKPSSPPGERIFGFKSHFEGPGDDAVELFFDADGYTGVSRIERGLTNVCGIVRESVLQRYGFDFDEIVRRSPPLAERLAPLRRQMRWLTVAPLSFGFARPEESTGRAYRVGDALGFIDPFTGSGILSALVTGRLAGLAAARAMPPAQYHSLCRRLLQRPFAISAGLRRLLGHAELYFLSPYLPGRLMFRSTRANIVRAVQAPNLLGG